MLALAVEELLRDLALVAAGHRPTGAQFPLALRPTLIAPGPAGREIAPVVVIQAVLGPFVRDNKRTHLGGRCGSLSLGSKKGRVHGAGRPGARLARPCYWDSAPRFDRLRHRTGPWADVRAGIVPLDP